MLTGILIAVGTFIAFVTSVTICASVVPASQYIYYQFIKKDQYQIKYYFSEHLFNRHMSHDIGLDDARVINNRKDLGELWEIEVKHKLP